MKAMEVALERARLIVEVSECTKVWLVSFMALAFLHDHN